jgi:trehalose/maltose hydrolase-like predicted phosphorylase
MTPPNPNPSERPDRQSRSTELGQVSFQISYRNHRILVDLTPSTMVLQLQARAVPPIRVCVDDKTTTMHTGRTYRFELGASR